jgi:para-nitrobenzyl esterase
MEGKIVQTRQGAVRGTLEEGVLAFKGLPFAAPPFGPNRFQPPQPHAAWEGVWDCTRYGPTVPKPPYFPPFDTLLPEPVIPGEDCLNLNIWTPGVETANLPVMVWVHGGAFANGTGAISIYDGTAFARDGVVCVTINYRLGADGFLFLDDGISNLGLLDQIAALEWVKDNIGAFGGDPANVTIFGESAGAFSVTTLLSMAQTKGLFRRVIAQSGAGHHVLSPSTAQRVGGYLAEKLNVPATREAITAVSSERVLQAQVELSGEAFAEHDPVKWGEVAGNLMPFEPVVDGTVLLDRPIDSIMAGASQGIDLLVGTNTDEFRLFMVPNGAIDYINEDILKGAIAGYGLPVAETLAAYRETHPEAAPGDLLEALTTDWYFRIPAIRLAEANLAQTGTNTYMYEFAWRSPQFNGRLGACHSIEIAFAFDTLDKPDNLPVTGPQPPQQLADVMHAAWVAFAKTSNPGWPRYDLEKRATMHFDQTQEVVNDPHSTQRTLWDDHR